MSAVDTAPDVERAPSRHRVLRAVNAVSLLCLAATFMALLLLVHALFPSLAVTVEFAVENRCGEPVLVTPVGAIDGAGTRMVLPIVRASVDAVPGPVHRAWPIAAGDRLSFTYAWDDIQFAEVVVFPVTGEPRALVVEPEATRRQFTIPGRRACTLPELELLPLAAPRSLQARDVPRRRMLWVLVVSLGVLAPFAAWTSWRAQYPRRDPE